MHRTVLGLVLAALTTVSACGGASPTTPTTPPDQIPTGPSPPATLSGVWQGFIRATACQSPYGCQAEQTASFVLRTLSTGDAYTGSLELTHSGETDILTGISGAPQPDGAVLFTGTRNRVELRRLLVRADGSSGLSGEIELWRRIADTDSGDVRLQGRIMSATYTPLAPALDQNVSGAWKGRAIIRACSGDCPIYENKGDEIDIEVVLGQTGTAVSGSFQGDFQSGRYGIPVTGTMTGSQVSLSSERIVRSKALSQHVERFEGVIDSLGRFTGRFVFAHRFPIAIEPFSLSSRLECEFLWLHRDWSARR